MQVFRSFMEIVAAAPQQLQVNTLPQAQATQGQVQNLLNIVFVITGAIAVMMVVIGGIKYASSGGDPSAVSKAKGTIIYALVGLALSILAVTIVSFVFTRVA